MSETLTPMMKQYRQIRRGLPADTLLLFRLGDFYELFFEDARAAAPILNVALTKRNGVPMCGVPYHAADGYIAKLIGAGRHVAVCDQVGEAQPGRIVQREVTQVLTPGTVTDLNMLDARRGNYLAGVAPSPGPGKPFGLAWAEMSTGEFCFSEHETLPSLENSLARIAPAEILVPDQNAPPLDPRWAVTTTDAYGFEFEHAQLALRDHFKTQSLDGFGLGSAHASIRAAGAVIHYLQVHLRRDLRHVLHVRHVQDTDHVLMDAATQANLELVQSRSSARDTSLLAAIDRTVTPMGARRLREWILQPLLDPTAILGRQSKIRAWIREEWLLSAVRSSLRGVRDVQRIAGRLAQGAANPRDLAALRSSLDLLPELSAHLETAPELRMPGVVALPGLSTLLTSALVDEPPPGVRDGGVIRENYHSGLDELRSAATDGKSWIARFQQQEAERTGVKSLKVRYNAVFGYYIEITRANLQSVPQDYQRKQTTANGERFVTPQLKEMESKILGAEERARALEQTLFTELREAAAAHLPALQALAAALAELDVLTALAEQARLQNYCAPHIDQSRSLLIKDGRHPVLDRAGPDENFVPNDTHFDPDTARLHIVTGPNMAGKSTYIRQVALIVLLAQIGSYVPASAAHIGVVDRIFTRVGASDDLARGQSTFMVEMNETAGILHNATERSLVILDEIGRGTSTFDGIAIAWSVAEHLHDVIRARTLFATHYHELTDLAATRPGVANFNVAVREWNDRIVFLRRIVPGAADKSYGIHVARLAGLPAVVLARAAEILANLEGGEYTEAGVPRIAETPHPVACSESKSVPLPSPQLELL